MTSVAVDCVVGASAARDAQVKVASPGVLVKLARAESLASVFVCAEQVAEAVPLAAELLQGLQAGGKLVLENASEDVSAGLLLSGFVDVAQTSEGVSCVKPGYTEAAVPLPKSDAKKDAWKALAGEDADDAELEDDDNLLTSEDLIQENKAADCGPAAAGTKKRACKNCSCGLKEMEEAEAAGEPVVVDPNSSACGSCAKGDAFRCATCPYLGTPAYDPNNKPQIKINPDGSKVLIDVGNDI
mmetsp:Transcript_10768/g.19011  ORF Transcript_10768/g.19011 Transcript_10768/m.19011 type:complete len:242 (-) Transcript_10768:90-815(-)|eukprot:CAMPEP_0184522944 /NCGR_PEP_ID=MMETSP0198_2-20121128/8585_1 /TAXON_ID=1112570 /ORGANISM="Thraustochytrium sp., Strain LLF1b" /LENGTH=241 /DNA_ID=CAMNT_0026913871 /DNA_START=131 /DNA_END=856 /DNA_ORIENTATION=+